MIYSPDLKLASGYPLRMDLRRRECGTGGVEIHLHHFPRTHLGNLEYCQLQCYSVPPVILVPPHFLLNPVTISSSSSSFTSVALASAFFLLARVTDSNFPDSLSESVVMEPEYLLFCSFRSLEVGF